MLGHDAFYYGSIRKYTASFGSLFNEISVIRGANLIRVPLAYSAQSRWFAANQQQPDDDTDTKVKMILPRMGFHITSIQYDSARARPRLGRAYKPTDSDNAEFQYQRVPFTLGFELSIATTNITDMLQILEQILPFFTPHFNLSVKDNPLYTEDSSDIAVRLESSNLVQEFEGSMDGRRVLVSDISFSLEGYLHGPIDGGPVIKHVLATTRDFNFQDEINNRLSLYELEPDPTTATAEDDYGYTETITVFDGNN